MIPNEASQLLVLAKSLAADRRIPTRVTEADVGELLVTLKEMSGLLSGASVSEWLLRLQSVKDWLPVGWIKWKEWGVRINLACCPHHTSAGEIRLAVSKLLFINEGKSTSLHSHEVRHEIFATIGPVESFVGEGGLTYRDGNFGVLYLPPRVKHAFTAAGPGTVLVSYALHRTDGDDYLTRQRHNLSRPGVLSESAVHCDQ